jgi:hypothetical protein
MLRLLTCIAVLTATAVARAGSPALLELDVKGEPSRQGKLVAMDDHECHLMTRDGRIETLPLGKVTGFRRVSATFRPFTSVELRDQLRREFGRGYEVEGGSRYVVVAPVGRARQYVEIFEDVYRGFRGYFGTRGFRVGEPEFPLVAVVYPDQSQFAAHCQKDGVRPVRGMVGYYLHSSNRVALFDPASEAVSQIPGKAEGLQPLGFARVGDVSASLRDVIVHEATHQVAFNAGLHRRLGENPKWIVEGLATVFEAPGVRDGGRGDVRSRVNRERFVWFGGFAASRRAEKSLAAFVSSDDLFRTAALDAYSQAWALSFFLVETRPSEYARYLKTVAARDPLSEYTPAERLKDFQDAFGSDLTMLEAEFLRFAARLRVEG